MNYGTRDVRNLGWELWEPGWWTHDRLGSIGRDSDGHWYFYPMATFDKRGPYRTLREAARDAGTRKED